MATKRKKDKGASGDNKKAKIEVEVVDRSQYADLVRVLIIARPQSVLLRDIVWTNFSTYVTTVYEFNGFTSLSRTSD